MYHMKPGLTLLTALLLWQTGLQPVRSLPHCSAPCLSSKAGKAYPLPTRRFQYELEGYFDKDEQGWCATRIEIQIRPDGAVTLRDWYDANGRIPSDRHYRGRVLSQFGQTLLLQLEGHSFNAHLGADRFGRVRLDLETGRLQQIRHSDRL